jgi:hypothetical protein
VRAGVPEDECTDLECIFAGLPPISCDRASVLLEGVRVHSEDKCMSLAAGFLLNLAHEIWNAPFLSALKREATPMARETGPPGLRTRV